MKISKTAVLVLALALSGIAIWFVSSRLINPQTPLKQQFSNSDVVMKVGQEEIYGSDFNYEVSRYPQEDPKAESLVLQKLIDDSVTLQGASEDRLITLDPDFYNSQNKNYDLRVQMVEEAKISVENNSSTIGGYVVSLWFRNNNWIGPDGLEANKQTALRKMTDLRNRVAEGKLTIQQAAEIIKNDASNAKLDKVYQNNAFFEFSAAKGQKNWITLSSELDQELWTLPTGQTSRLYVGTGKDENTGESYDALYLFGIVTSKSSKETNYIPYQDWLESKKNIYEVQHIIE